jgi:hypothetical protein
MTRPRLPCRFAFFTASKQASSPSKQRAGPVNFSFDMPATFTIAPSGREIALQADDAAGRR